jgi:hypothetical protein
MTAEGRLDLELSSLVSLPVEETVMALSARWERLHDMVAEVIVALEVRCLRRVVF